MYFMIVYFYKQTVDIKTLVCPEKRLTSDYETLKTKLTKKRIKQNKTSYGLLPSNKSCTCKHCRPSALHSRST